MSDFQVLYEKGDKSINELCQLKNDQIRVAAGVHVHKECRRIYTKKRKSDTANSDTGIPNVNTRTSSGGFNFKTHCFYCGCMVTEREKNYKKCCLVSCKNREVDKAVEQTIRDRGNDEWSVEVKGRLASINDLHAEDAIYHVRCSSSFRTGHVIPRVMMFRTSVADLHRKTRKVRLKT